MHTKCLLEKNEATTALNSECEKQINGITINLDVKYSEDKKQIAKNFYADCKAQIGKVMTSQALVCQKEKDEQKTE